MHPTLLDSTMSKSLFMPEVRLSSIDEAPRNIQPLEFYNLLQLQTKFLAQIIT